MRCPCATDSWSAGKLEIGKPVTAVNCRMSIRSRFSRVEVRRLVVASTVFLDIPGVGS